MTETLLLVTQVTSLISFILILVTIIMSLISFLKFRGDNKFKRGILLFIIYMISFLLAVGVMSLYHWLDSELMETLWYVMLNVGLLLGIVSGFMTLSFWKEINSKLKKFMKNK